MSMEWLYEYGSRAGFWRLYRLFTERGLPATVFAVGMALERNPEAARAMVAADFEIAARWRGSTTSMSTKRPSASMSGWRSNRSSA